MTNKQALQMLDVAAAAIKRTRVKPINVKICTKYDPVGAPITWKSRSAYVKISVEWKDFARLFDPTASDVTAWSTGSGVQHQIDAHGVMFSAQHIPEKPVAEKSDCVCDECTSRLERCGRIKLSNLANPHHYAT